MKKLISACLYRVQLSPELYVCSHTGATVTWAEPHAPAPGTPALYQVARSQGGAHVPGLLEPFSFIPVEWHGTLAFSLIKKFLLACCLQKIKNKCSVGRYTGYKWKSFCWNSLKFPQSHRKTAYIQEGRFVVDLFGNGDFGWNDWFICL